MALLHEEDGVLNVHEAIALGAAISLVNLAEVLSKLADLGNDPAEARIQLDEVGNAVEQLTEADCVEVARLRPLTRALGLSLADRACIALAMRLDVPVLTADRLWAQADLDVEVRLIR